MPAPAKPRQNGRQSHLGACPICPKLHRGESDITKSCASQQRSNTCTKPQRTRATIERMFEQVTLPPTDTPTPRGIPPTNRTIGAFVTFVHNSDISSQNGHFGQSFDRGPAETGGGGVYILRGWGVLCHRTFRFVWGVVPVRLLVYVPVRA